MAIPALLLGLAMPSPGMAAGEEAEEAADSSVRTDQVLGVQVGGKTLHACTEFFIEIASPAEHAFTTGTHICWFETRDVEDRANGWNLGATYGYTYGVSGRWSPFVWARFAKPFADGDRYYAEIEVDAGVRIRLGNTAEHWALRASAFRKELIGADGQEDTSSFGVSVGLALGRWLR